MNKPGTAMCHMDSPQGARNAIQYLHGQKLMGQTLELKYVKIKLASVNFLVRDYMYFTYLFCSFSRHSYIADYSQSEALPDGSPCWKDFSQSRNNR